MTFNRIFDLKTTKYIPILSFVVRFLNFGQKNWQFVPFGKIKPQQKLQLWAKIKTFRVVLL